MHGSTLGGLRASLAPVVAVAVGLGSGVFVFAMAAGATGSWRGGLAIGVPASALVGWLSWRRPPVPIDDAACTRSLKIVSALGAALALVQLVRLAVFMVAPERVGSSWLPSSEWEIRHSCVSAYYVAAKSAGEGANIYDDSLYTAPDDDPRAPRKARMLGPFRVDVFEYPPAFLPVPRALLVLAPDFVPFRSLWFGLSGAVVLVAMLVTARLMGPSAGTRALLYSSLIWASFNTVSTLQKGNVHLVVIAVSMLAMAFSQRRRWASGGALLAFATVSKLFPGLLAIDLIVRRRWRALAWTAAFGLGLILVTLVDVGWSQFASFLEHLPGLVGGEAFPAFRNPAAIAINLSVPGLVFKLKLFGLAGASFAASKAVGWIYTVVAIWATVVIARRQLPDAQRPLAWMAILVLATLRSPFLPLTYAVFAPLWLLTLVSAVHSPSTRAVLLTVAGWLVFDLFLPPDWAINPRWAALLNVLPQALTIALVVLVARSTPARESSILPAEAALAD